jgi:DsbC/DsbD-like thiol-disulfide interchange protein
MRGHHQKNSNSLIALTIAILLAVSLTPFVTRAAAKKRNGVSSHRPTVTVVDDTEVKVRIALSQAQALAGQRVGVIVDFAIAPGWHVYGKPLPEEYTPTTLTFDRDLVNRQNLDFPKPTPVKFELLGETLSGYQDRFRVVGEIVLQHNLSPGEHQLSGTLSFQECNDNLCKMPQQVRFDIPLRIDSAGLPAPG